MRRMSTLLVGMVMVFTTLVANTAIAGPEDFVDAPTHDDPVCVVNAAGNYTGNSTVMMYVTPGDDLVVNGEIRHDRNIPITGGAAIQVWAARDGNESDDPHEYVAAAHCPVGEPANVPPTEPPVDSATHVDDPVIESVTCESDASGNNTGDTVVVVSVTPGDDLIEGGDLVFARRFVIAGLADKIFQATRDSYLSAHEVVVDALHCPAGEPNDNPPVEPPVGDPATHVDDPVILSVTCQLHPGGGNTGDTLVLVSVTPGDDLIEGGDLVFEREFVIAGLADKHFQATRHGYLSANEVVVDALHCPR